MDQHIVVNDMISFISCKIKNCNKEVLLRTVKKFYSTADIEDAKKVLIDFVPNSKTTYKARSALKNKNAVLGIYECLRAIPEDEAPFFVCRDLNNIPAFEDNKQPDQLNRFKLQQKGMEDQLSTISSTVTYLQTQIEILSKVPLLKATNKAKSSKRKLSNSITPRPCKKSVPVHSGLAHLQKLIDEEADKDTEDLDDDAQEVEEYTEYSDWEEDLLDFENVSHKDSDDPSKIIIVSPNFESKLNNPDMIFKNPGIHYEPANSMLVSSGSNSRIRQLNSHSTTRGKQYFDIDDRSPEFKRPYIIVENGFDENIGNFLVYRCSLCNFASNDENALPEHTCNIPQPVQVDPQRYTCQFCEFIAENARNLNQHLQMHRKTVEVKAYQCVLCYFSCNDSDIYKEHLRSHSWKRPYTCELCDFKANDQNKIKKHSYWHLEYKGPEHYECQACDKVCGSVNALEKHKMMHSRNLEFECCYCGISFHSEGKLYTHVLTHTKEKSYACKYCDHATDSLHYLIHHETGHLRDKKAECHICGEIFSNRSTLKYHIQNEHRDMKSFKCDVCFEGFTSESDARMHRKKAHDDTVKLVCPHCMKIYKDPTYYRLHIEMHEQEVKL